MKILSTDFECNKYGLFVRFIRAEDAEFIVNLRTNEKLGRFINKTENNVSKQIQWISDYKKRESLGKDYYFIFIKENERLGVCRIYNISENSFETGSWLFSPLAPINSAIVADIITREIAFELFPNSCNYFDVRKGNKNVLRYHSFYNAEIYNEDDLSLFYKVNRDDFELGRKKFLRMLIKQ